MAVRQQLSSMLYVMKICEVQIKSLKTGDIDTSVLNQVFKTFHLFLCDVKHDVMQTFSDQIIF